MIISVINHTSGEISDEELETAIRAINRQIREDFEPYWSLGANLRLEGRSQKSPKKNDLADMRGDAIIYMWNQTDVKDALGYHDQNYRGIPYGFVFTALAAEIGDKWTVTLSHEALELIGDPEANLLVQGPHPEDKKRAVFHWYEMCDAVQEETYQIDGIDVSNFVLPLYFTGGDELGGRNDFLSRVYNGKTLKSFSVNPGGYVGFFDPTSGEHETFSRKEDKRAQLRLQYKLRTETARITRHQFMTSSRDKPCDHIGRKKKKVAPRIGARK